MFAVVVFVTRNEHANETTHLHPLPHEQALAETSGPGGRWLVLESVSRAASLASVTSSGGAKKSRAAAEAAASKLADLLACAAIFELRVRPDALSSEKGVLDGDGAVGAAGLLRYLRVCAAHLPRPEHASSLYAEDHLTVSPAASSSPVDKPPASASGGAGVAAVTSPPLLGDVLVSILHATVAVPEGTGSKAVWEAVSAVVLHGYERRPLSALGAVAINGILPSVSGGQGKGRRGGRQQKRDGGAERKVVAATRALCVAATFVRAASEAAETGETVDAEDYMVSAEKDLVAVFPAAMLAVASDDKVCCVCFLLLGRFSIVVKCLSFACTTCCF